MKNSEVKFVKLLRSVFNLTWANNIQVSLKTFVELIGGVVILWAGGVSVINGDMTIGGKRCIIARFVATNFS